MTIEIWGRRRNGKTSMGVALCLHFKHILKFRVYSNDPKMVTMGIAERLTKEILLKEKHCIFFIDEFWREMDSQDWKNPQSRLMTHWWQLQGHHDVVLVYTTQLRSQMNNRIRESNDYSIYCERERIKEELYRFTYRIFDGVTWNLLRTLKTDSNKMKNIYRYYDHIGNAELVLTNNNNNE